jgi:hypothetical protein
MWQEIGSELSIPWQEAEAMNWRLGMQGISERAKYRGILQDKSTNRAKVLSIGAHAVLSLV